LFAGANQSLLVILNRLLVSACLLAAHPDSVEICTGRLRSMRFINFKSCEILAIAS
jgi:hypothetical protein